MFWRLEGLEQIELLKYSVCDQPMLVHVPHATDYYVEHILAHQVGVLGRVRFVYRPHWDKGNALVNCGPDVSEVAFFKRGREFMR